MDCGRAAILLPLGFSILNCEPIRKCTLLETAFLLLVTVSTINMLTIVLNDSPIFPDDGSDEELVSGPLLMDSPQCVLFGTFMIWFASVIINLGPTFLSGGLAARNEMIRNTPGCPLVHGPFRHYILNALWIDRLIIFDILLLPQQMGGIKSTFGTKLSEKQHFRCIIFVWNDWEHSWGLLLTLFFIRRIIRSMSAGKYSVAYINLCKS